MTAEKPSKAMVWKTIYSTLIANAIIPLDVSLHPNDISVTIRLQDDEFDDVAAALATFGLPSGEIWSLDNDGPHLWSKGEDGEFYAWGRYCNHYAKSPLLPGWNVSIYCQVRTANYPLPAAEPSPCDCFAPLPAVDPAAFGPCSGLAADKRDNTCQNFAAEYVVFPSATVGLVDEFGEFSSASDGRRLCTPCADSVPNPMERRPLTTAPGGHPVEASAVTR